MNRLTRALLGVLLLGLPLSGRSAPTLTYLFPAGGEQGSSFSVQAGGDTKPWPLQAWTDCPGVRFTPTTNQGTFEVSISTNSPAGPHLVRLYSDETATEVRTFVVGSQPEIAEVEPNDHPDNAQTLDGFPVTVNGRLAKRGEIDSFAIPLQQGQTLVASVESYSLGSPIDPHLHLFNPDRIRVAFGHDSHNLDPRLRHTATESGLHLLQLAGFVHPPAADVQFHGADNVIYRLNLTTGTHPADAGPAVLPRQPNASFPFPATPETTEEEIEAAGNEAVPLTLPIVVNGRINPAGDADTFQFEAVKGTSYDFRLKSVELGFQLDGHLRVLDGSGKELARADDTDGERDPTLNWKAPADGTHSIVVADLYERGAPDLIYRLQLAPAVPGFSSTVPATPLTLKPGGSTELKVSVKRTNGHKAPLTIEIDFLPEGVRFEAEAIPEKDGEVKVTFTAAEEIPPAAGAVRVRITESEGAPHRSTEATHSLRSSDHRGPILIDQTPWLWLTIEPRA